MRPLAALAAAHPLVASIALLAIEGVPLVLVAPSAEVLHVLAVLSVGLALLIAFPLHFRGFIRDVIALDDGIRRGEEKRDARIEALESWRAELDCTGCEAKAARLDQVAQDVDEVRRLPPIEAALRQRTRIPE